MQSDSWATTDMRSSRTIEKTALRISTPDAAFKCSSAVSLGLHSDMCKENVFVVMFQITVLGVWGVQTDHTNTKVLMGKGTNPVHLRCSQ